MGCRILGKFVSFGLLFLLCSASSADYDKARCDKNWKLVSGHLFAGKARYQQDLDRQSDWFYPGRLKEMISSTRPEDLWKVTSEISKDDLIEMYHAMEGGYLRISDKEHPDGRPLTKAEEQFLWDLYTFAIQDTNYALWEGKTMEERTVAIQKKLEELYPEHGYDASMEKASVDAIASATNTEKNLFTRALTSTDPQTGERLPGTGWWKQLFMPLAPRMKQIKSVNDGLREELQHAQAVDQVILEATLNRAKELGLKPEQIQGMRWLIAKTAGQTAAVREKLAHLYGVELSHRDGEPIKSLDPYAIHKRAKEFEAEKEQREYETTGERELDHMEAEINKAMIAQGKGPRPMSDFFDKELQLRHIEMARRTPEAADRHNGALGRASGENFVKEYTWTETETYYETESYTDSDGNSQTRMVARTRLVTRYGSDTHYPSYWEVVSGNIDTSAPRGSLTNSSSVRAAEKDILKRSQAARKVEQPMWYRVAHLEEELLKLVEEHGTTLESGDKSIQKTIDRLTSMRKELNDNLPSVRKYSESSRGDVEKRWDGDNYDDFRNRTGRMVKRYETVMRFVDIYGEQLKRQEKVLEFPYENPEYPVETAALEKKEFNGTVIKLLGGGGILSAIGGGVYLYSNNTGPIPVNPDGDDDTKKRKDGRTDDGYPIEGENEYSAAPTKQKQQQLAQKFSKLQPLLGAIR